jgi:hypothetical protein
MEGNRSPDRGRSGRLTKIALNVGTRQGRTDRGSSPCPTGHEVTHELLRAVVARVDLRDGPELRVRSEDEGNDGGGPLDLARGAIPTLVRVLSEADAFHSVAMSSRFTKKSLVIRLSTVDGLRSAVSSTPVVGRHTRASDDT